MSQAAGLWRGGDGRRVTESRAEGRPRVRTCGVDLGEWDEGALSDHKPNDAITLDPLEWQWLPANLWRTGRVRVPVRAGIIWPMASCCLPLTSYLRPANSYLLGSLVLEDGEPRPIACDRAVHDAYLTSSQGTRSTLPESRLERVESMALLLSPQRTQTSSRYRDAFAAVRAESAGAHQGPCGTASGRCERQVCGRWRHGERAA